MSKTEGSLKDAPDYDQKDYDSESLSQQYGIESISDSSGHSFLLNSQRLQIYEIHRTAIT